MKVYIRPFLFLFAVGLGAVSLIYYNLIEDTATEVIIAISVLGLGFGVFQLWFSEIKADRRRQWDIRYQAYKELIKATEVIPEVLNIEMGNSLESNPHGLISSLINITNNFHITVEANDELIFPGIKLNDNYTRLCVIIVKILERTNVLRKNTYNLAKDADSLEKTNLDEWFKVAEQTNWHNDTNKLLADFHKDKHDFYSHIRSYLR